MLMSSPAKMPPRHASHWPGVLLLLAAFSSCCPAWGKDAVKTVNVVFSCHMDVGFDGIEPLAGLDNNVINK